MAKWTEEAKSRQREKMLEHYSTHDHPMTGKKQPPEWINNARDRRWPAKREELEQLSRVELVKKAQARGIRGATRMRKALLVDTLLVEGGNNGKLASDEGGNGAGRADR
jgi:hypothetical protein